jgi:hypothetical protein
MTGRLQTLADDKDLSRMNTGFIMDDWQDDWRMLGG